MFEFDLDQAKEQLKALGYTEDETVYLRAFFPNSDPRSKEPGSARKKESPASNLPVELIEDWQKDGRGVYFVVQGGGHRDSDVTRCRAIFYEHDNLSKEISANLWRSLGMPQPTY